MLLKSYVAFGASHSLVRVPDTLSGAFFEVDPKFGGRLHQLGLPLEDGDIHPLLDTYVSEADLISSNDSALIRNYTRYHRHIWPEVERAFRQAGIIDFKVYLFGNKTFLLMETHTDFDLTRDLTKISGKRVDAWDKLMSTFQDLKGNESWQPVQEIYHMSSAGTGDTTIRYNK